MTSTNKNYAEQMKQFLKAQQPGTPEYIHKKSYPGAAMLVHCAHPECVWCEGGSQRPIMSQWLCDDCKRRVPCPVNDYRTHAPWLRLPSKEKQRAAAAAAFVGYVLAERGG
jgi:hypothetical protein